MEEILRSAINSGFKVWGFSPHAPISIESGCNMQEASVQEYKLEIERLRNIYPQIKIFEGMEVDYLDPLNGPSSEILKKYDLDYIIGSVHFIPNQKGEYHDIDGSPERFKTYLHEYFEDDLEYVVKTFWHQTFEMIRRGGFDIIGHVDKISLNASSVDPEIEERPFYKELAANTINEAILSGRMIEINTKHWKKYGRFFPHPRYWQRILQAGIFMPVNSDTHYSELVNEGRDEALTLLNSMRKKLLGK
ncbi:MAG: histidinol-phosphatase [Muribaculaceae bacterium]|nr:histidinol-phosphatase [Muribaculaceae bacterium]